MCRSEMEAEEIPATHSKETTPTPSAVKPVSTGRPHQSSVWNLFSFDAAKSRSVCEVEIRVDDRTTKFCGVEISGKFPTNLVCVLCCVCCAVCVRMCMSTLTSLSDELS